jgi:hypothetical protein
LGFGDVNLETDEFDDEVISNNNDTTKVLATVANSVSIFLDKYPEASVYAEGSTRTRTRLYQISISKYFVEITKKYQVFGYLEGVGWGAFKKNINYSAFLIMNK